MIAPWRSHPALQGRFHDGYPDDLQVIVHDGGPRLTSNRPELVWVRVTGMTGDLFTGEVLNQPFNLQRVTRGSEIRFAVVKGAPNPVMLTDKYLAERGSWRIQPCDKCGMPELFDAPSELIPAIFPSAPPDAVMVNFTSFCPMCGGVQMLEHIDQPS